MFTDAWEPDAAPLYGDESYQGPPAEDFESSRAGGVVGFTQGVSVASGLPGSGGLLAAWNDAASQGQRPVDFGFLIDKSSNDIRGAGTEVVPAALPESCKKRGRTDEIVPDVRVGPTAVKAPCPPRRPQSVLFGQVEGEDRGPSAMEPPIVRTDVFAWMRKESHADEEIMSLLKNENKYTQASQQHLASLREVLYKEMLGHQREAETSEISLYPGGYGYFTRTFIGRSYQAHYRCQKMANDTWGKEELVLDENRVAAASDSESQRPFCLVDGPHPNPAHTAYAYGTDFSGDGAYQLHLLQSPGAVCTLPSLSIERTDGCVQWSQQGDSFYYVALDEDFRAYKVRHHILGSPDDGVMDSTVFEEEDRKFNVSLCRSGCMRFLILTSASSETTEVHILDLHNPASGLQRVAPRLFEHRYSVDHMDGWLYILTNKDAHKNSKLCRVPLTALPNAAFSMWDDVWVPQPGIKLDSHHCFKDFVVLDGREKGQCRIFVHGCGRPSGPPLHALSFPDAAAHSGHVLTPRDATAAQAAFSASLGENHMFDTDVVRYQYSSFTLPNITYEYNVKTREHKVLRKQEVPNFDPSLYRAERIISKRRSVPVSLVYRKDIHSRGLAGGPFPAVLTGYGAYGCCQDPDFDGYRLSLLDRGIVYAIAHVRGGGEYGREWYEDGRYMAVKNRFADFVDAAETLIELRITTSSQLAAWGTSSGGLLVTASMNLRPDLFRAVLLEVPFVDVMNTMVDPSIPLTVGEWEEVGNPNEREYFYYMLEYSPYDNLRMEAYPAALITASLNDSMVGYWEPVKYASKLRLMKTDDRPVFVWTNFHAGHGSSSDRYELMRESAFHFAFLLEQLGLAQGSLLGA